VNAVVEAMTLAGLDRKGVAIGAKSVVLSNGVLTPFHQSLVERVIALDKGQKVGIEMVEIHAVPVEAHDATAIGFKFYCPRFTLGYVPETKYTKELVDNLSGSDILIITLPVPENKENKCVMDKMDAMKLVQKIRPRLAIITHFGLDMLRADPLIVARDIQRKTNVQTIAAKDGLSINPDSYSAKSPQYRLAKFYR
jgi:L-ascorbate metabolism protein UlaG (beta-lactamase superfamily)